MSDRKKSIIALVIAFVLFIGLFGGLFIHPNIQERRENAEMEENNRRFETFQLLHLVERLEFDSVISETYHFRNLHSVTHLKVLFGDDRIEISEVVLVHSAEENVGFSEDVFVAWPSDETPRALREQNLLSGTGLTLEEVLVDPNAAFHAFWPNQNAPTSDVE